MQSERKSGATKMITGIHEQAGSSSEEQHDIQISGRRLWSAVLLQALDDWKSSNTRRRSEAEKFLFNSEKDFIKVCQGAGLEPSYVVGKLQNMKTTIQQPKPWYASIQQAVVSNAFDS
jgi:hypothetical protein